MVSAAADRGNGGPEAWIHRAHVSKPKHIITLLSDSRRLVVRLSDKHCQLDLIVLHALPAGQTSETKNQASLWWDTLQELLALDLLPLQSCVCVDSNGRVGSNTCDRLATRRVRLRMSMEQVCVFWWRPCTCRSHKQKYSNKTIGPGSLRREPNIALTFWALRRQCSPRYTLVLPLTRFCSAAGIFRIIELW